MIYMIGGPPRCGKTTVSKLLSAQRKLPWISADTLESIVSETLATAYGSREDERYLSSFPKDVLRKMTEGSNDRMYSEHSAADIAVAYVRQASVSAGAIAILVACEIAEGHDYIVEGHQIQPRLVQDLTRKYPNEIRALFLIKTDVAAIEAGLRANSAPNDWAQKMTSQDETYGKIAAMITTYSQWFGREAGECGQACISMDVGIFSERLDEAVLALA